MATLLSNELKAVVVPDNFLDNPINVLKENCLTVQHFDYECEHKRNDSEEEYDRTQNSQKNCSVTVEEGQKLVVKLDTTKVDDNGDKQMMLNVTLQVRSVIYLGRENNFKSTFIE